jgi:hypothetical protein
MGRNYSSLQPLSPARRTPLKVLRVLLFCLLMAAVPSLALAQADVQEKIRALEQQLEALRELKARQDLTLALREKECNRVFPSPSFCSCLVTRLPADVSFEQYVMAVGKGSQQGEGLAAIRDACAAAISP